MLKLSNQTNDGLESAKPESTGPRSTLCAADRCCSGWRDRVRASEGTRGSLQ